MAKGVKLCETECSTHELAKMIGKTPAWVRQLTRDGVLKQVGRGRYVLGKTIQAYVEYAQGGKEEQGKPRLIDEKTEHERIKKERATLELQILRGEWHAAKDVEELVGNLILGTKSRLQSISKRLAPQLANESAGFIEKKMAQEMDAALSGLSQHSSAILSRREVEG